MEDDEENGACEIVLLPVDQTPHAARSSGRSAAAATSPGTILSSAYEAASRRLYAGTESGSLVVFAMTSRAQPAGAPHEVGRHAGAITCMARLPMGATPAGSSGGGILVTGSADVSALLRIPARCRM